jgi:hypothetical protein
LSAQGNTPTCAYRDESGCPCAVGAALDDETAKLLDLQDDTDVLSLISKGLLKADDEDGLIELQDLHDRWAKAVNGSPFYGAPEECEAAFVETLDRLLSAEA